jgi:hypothetical protein
MTLLADNSEYEKEVDEVIQGAGHGCENGYFNNGCVEVMDGGQFRDGAFEGFPLGSDAVILNRAGSYLAVGPEKTFDYAWNGTNTENTHYRWYAGWLIGPAATGKDAPRIVWDNGNSKVKYIEVRPGNIAIDANVTVKKTVGLIYSVWFVGSTQVTVNVDPSDALSLVSANAWGNNPVIKGLTVNNTDPGAPEFRFYGNKAAKIVVHPGSYIAKYAVTGAPEDVYTFITSGDSNNLEIKGVTGDDINGTDYVDSTTNIKGWNPWGAIPGNESPVSPPTGGD